MRTWRNWQTRKIQVLMVERLCRFKSCCPHHYPSRLTRAFSRKDFPCTTTPSPCAVHPRASRRPGGSPFPCRALSVRQVLLSAPLPESFDSGFFTKGLSLHDDSVALCSAPSRVSPTGRLAFPLSGVRCKASPVVRTIQE